MNRTSCLNSSAFFLGVVVAIVVAIMLGSSVYTVPAQAAAHQTSIAASDAPKNNKVYAPLIVNDVNPLLATRIGYGTTLSNLGQYSKVRELNAGWYVNWLTSANPSRPGGIEYVQMLRVHQKTTCGSRKTPNRITCPYKEPQAYEFGLAGELGQPQVASIAAKNPGSTWLIGNECDRMDWDKGGQDEILPELYARAFHEARRWIKTADPTAKIAICGVIQPTPLRLQYLTIVWDTYKALYGVDMPVDIWNTHAFIIREKSTLQPIDPTTDEYLENWGAGIPPGIIATQGEYPNDCFAANAYCPHVDMTVFDKQIRAFRSWMKARNQENKPLIVTEYGVLYYWLPYSDNQAFMLETFDYFLNEKDCVLSSVDGCRLVQQWAWFSLDNLDDSERHPHVLYNEKTNQILSLGNQYADFVEENLAKLKNYQP
ncbi:MAG: hypothetical protein HC802_02190 [Caldilineaceae bacterium]|nr:hypothetical protein [Caldilineaceae bacterium]